MRPLQLLIYSNFVLVSLLLISCQHGDGNNGNKVAFKNLQSNEPTISPTPLPSTRPNIPMISPSPSSMPIENIIKVPQKEATSEGAPPLQLELPIIGLSSLNGPSIEDLSIAVATNNALILAEAQKVIQAHEEYVHELGERSAELLFLRDAAIREYNTVVADQISALHTAFGNFLKEKFAIYLWNSKATFLQTLLRRLESSVRYGEASPAVLDYLGSFIGSNDIKVNLAQQNSNQFMNLMLGLTGNHPDVFALPPMAHPLPDLKNVAILDTSMLIEPAFNESTKIMGLELQRAAAFAAIARLELGSDNVQEIHREQARIDELSAKIAEQQDAIIATFATAQTDIDSGIRRYTSTFNTLGVTLLTYDQELIRIRNDETEVIEFISIVDLIFDRQLELGHLAIDHMRSLWAIDRLLYLGPFSLALNPPEAL